MVSVWNKGTFPRIKELKACKFLSRVNKKDSVLARAEHTQQLMKMPSLQSPMKKPSTQSVSFEGCHGPFGVSYIIQTLFFLA